MELKELIRKLAIKNAHDYGKADPKAVAGKVIAEMPSAKSDMKLLMALINESCNEVNTLSEEQIDKEYNSYGIVEEKREEKREWKIEGASEGQVITRFAPEPNGFLHIGHTKAMIINKKICDAYKGKFYVKFDDTNPEKCRQEFVDSILNDIAWFGIKPDGVFFVSDMLEDMIKTMEKLLREGNAYVCMCSQEATKEKRARGEECECRQRSIEENLALWEQMKTTMKEGEAVVRLKGDMKSLNTTMRDPALFRVLETPHYRQGKKYRVYPTYDFETSVSDALLGVTHVLRSKEFELRAELQSTILRLAGLRSPQYYEFARLAIDGYPVSKRYIKPYVESGFFSGYDDPRLVTLAGLRRRGIPPKAIEEYVTSFGLSKVEVETDLKKLFAETRKYYEPIVKHYYAVKEPRKLRIEGLGSGVLAVRLHPTANMGTRPVPFSEEVLISAEDFNELHELELVRLKDLKNINVTKIQKGKEAQCIVSISQEIVRDSKKLQWVDARTAVPCTFWYLEKPFNGEEKNEKSLVKVEGVCEAAAAKNIAEGEVVQLERMGYFILDNKEKMIFIRTD
ncbi:MAG: glutamate--tRNA ligase [Candidatus Micrarchaeia archaeon]